MFDARVKCAQHENTQHPKNTNDGATDQQMTMAHLLGRLFAINDNANELIVAVELYEQMRAQFDKDASSVNGQLRWLFPIIPLSQLASIKLSAKYLSIILIIPYFLLIKPNLD
jgi:hypothetical protein